MTRFVIGPDVALRIVTDGVAIAAEHQLLAPTLLRSQVLAMLYRDVAGGVLSRAEAGRRLDHVRRLKLRLLGDRVLQEHALRIAEELKLPDTFEAEYLALTHLQADAFVTLDPAWARAARKVVAVARFEDLLA